MKKHSVKNKQYTKIGLLITAVFIVASILVLGVNQSPHFTARVEAASTCPTTAPYGSASGNTVQIPTTGTYTAWSRVMVPAKTNGYFLKIDSTCYKIVGSNLTANQWGWISFENGSSGSVIRPNLTAGSHTVGFISSDPNVKVDKALFVNSSCVPTTITGDNCIIVDDAPPSVKLTAPIASTTPISGSIKLTANAVDDIKVSKVEFLVDGNVVGASSTVPYEYSWNTATTSAGNHTVTAKAYDGTGHFTVSAGVAIKVLATTAPKGPVYIGIPTSGSTVSGANAGFAIGHNGTKPSKVEIFVDNKSVGTAGFTAYGWLSFWNSNTVTNGSHTVIAKSTVGTTINTSSPITIKVNNRAGDTVRPSTPGNIRITKRVNRGRTITWNASTDNYGVDVYWLFVNNKATALTKGTTYTMSNLALSTQYTVKVVASDGAGNQSTAASLTFSTSNAAGELAGGIL